MLTAGDDRIDAIKVVREVTGMGLEEAIELVESPMPRAVFERLPLGEARRLAERFDDSGTRVIVAQHGRAVMPAVTQRLVITRFDPVQSSSARAALHERLGFELAAADEILDAVAGNHRTVLADASLETIFAASTHLHPTCELAIHRT